MVTEPINLREWKAPGSSWQRGRLFTCGRPGRGTYGRAKVTVAEHIIDRWAGGLPKADVLYIVSLLGRKTTGLSEFSYYPFRSSEEHDAKPTLQEWLTKRYGQRFIVHEVPTVDGRGIPRGILDAAARSVRNSLERGHTTVVIDSAGAERSGRVCEAIGYKLGIES